MNFPDLKQSLTEVCCDENCLDTQKVGNQQALATHKIFVSL